MRRARRWSPTSCARWTSRRGVKVITQSRVPCGLRASADPRRWRWRWPPRLRAPSTARSTPTRSGRSCATRRRQTIGVPTGVQDYLAAIHGGVLGIHLEPGELRVEKLATDPARVEECLLLVDSGVSRFSGLNNWEVFKGQIDGKENVRKCLGEIVGRGRGRARGPGHGPLRRRRRASWPRRWPRGCGWPPASRRRRSTASRRRRPPRAARPRSAARAAAGWSRSGPRRGKRDGRRGGAAGRGLQAGAVPARPARARVDRGV